MRAYNLRMATWIDFWMDRYDNKRRGTAVLFFQDGNRSYNNKKSGGHRRRWVSTASHRNGDSSSLSDFSTGGGQWQFPDSGISMQGGDRECGHLRKLTTLLTRVPTCVLSKVTERGRHHQSTERRRSLDCKDKDRSRVFSMANSWKVDRCDRHFKGKHSFVYGPVMC